MKVVILLMLMLATVMGADINTITIKGNYRYNKAIKSYIKKLPQKKITTVTHLAYTLWQESRNRSSGNVEYHYNMVASVILNRVKLKKKIYGNTIYRVIHKKRQFSCWGKDGNTQSVKVNKDYKEFLLALKVAYRYVHLNKQPITNAVYYHTTIVNPKWNKNMTITSYFGGHVFYE